MKSIVESERLMRRLEKLAYPSDEDIPFFNAHIEDLGPDCTYREALETLSVCAMEELISTVDA